VSLVQVLDVSFAIGDQPILRGAALALEPGERVALIGRNGAGKSTLFKLIVGELQPDAGEVRRRRRLRISQLDQSLPLERPTTVSEHVAGGLDHLRGLIAEHRAMSQRELDAAGLRELTELQHAIEDEGGWDVERRVATVLTELGLPGERRLDELSGGWRRRVGLARALVSNPELLLLDEPTNHLDLATIDWLEQRLLAFEGSLLFVTHDRAFLQRLATRVVEIERARLLSFPGDWRRYQEQRDAALAAEAKAEALFDKRLAEEEAWVRRGIEARRTRSAGRVRELERMRREYAERIKPAGRARIRLAEAESSGKRVVEMEGVTHGFGGGGPPLIEDLTLTVMRGDRIGLIGNNGVGKSTLLKLMLGELEPQRGKVKLGTGIEVGYFDQLRRALDPERTVAETVGDGRDHVRFAGKPIHVVGYLKGFLFSAKRALTKVGALSGGEQNRLILARLFTRPTNLLVLDEPTNDLDVETLEVLEEQLCDYQGTLLVVSHDREFLDNVVTSTVVFESGGRLRSYPGGYADWLRQGQALAEGEGMLGDPGARRAAARAEASAAAELAAREAERKVNRGRPKLSYHLQRELEALPARIEALEREVAALEAASAAPEFYAKPFAEQQPTLERLTAARTELDAAVERWAELESLAG
jgi:ATP-binding cassette subfamily F protein uup